MIVLISPITSATAAGVTGAVCGAGVGASTRPNLLLSTSTTEPGGSSFWISAIASAAACTDAASIAAIGMLTRIVAMCASVLRCLMAPLLLIDAPNPGPVALPGARVFAHAIVLFFNARHDSVDRCWATALEKHALAFLQ